MGAKTIWMNPPLEKLAEECSQDKNNTGRNGKFSRRIGDIVERYDVIIKLTPPPNLTVEERMILGIVICGKPVSPIMLRHMGESILDSNAAPEEELKALAKRANSWSAAEKILVIESFDK